MQYFNNIIEVIGNTPLVKLNKITRNVKPLILAKLEFLNPGGSVKDRIGIRMITEAEKKGLIKPGWTIVEPTSGNTGTGLALYAIQRGYKMIFTMPDKMSKEKEALLRAFGAEVVRTPTDVDPEDPRSNYKVAERLVKEIGTAFSPNQYFNLCNPQAHYETTGPEIWRDTGGKITHFVAGVGTGGTISGVSRYLKEKNPNIKIIGADPEGSIYHHAFYNIEGKVRPYKTEGIGEDFLPATANLSAIDEIVRVLDKDAFLMARRLAQEEGVLVGSSAGAALHAALQISKNLTEDQLIVVLIPDTGRNYITTIFNDEWMLKNGFLEEN
ncbi:MAG: PLP-dependent cysteine synthase family protein [Candidatus Hermodarchaeota archaeon]